ncbi:MAG: hypothetical protein ACE5H7_10950 [Acidiferrobacterales bacterium]
MDRSLVFVRTGKGNDEVTTRKYHLPQRLRTVLILIDGRANVAQLHEKAVTLGDLESTLEDLAIHGFIEVNSPAWDRRVERRVEHSGGLPVADRRKGSSDPRYGPMKARLIDLAILTFGSDAEKLVKKFIVASTDRGGLEKAVTDCAKLIALTIDQNKADEFKTKCLQVLGEA